MKNNKVTKILTLILFFLAFNVSFLFSHDLWLTKKKNEYMLHYGHAFSDHKGKKVRYPKNSLQFVGAIKKDGTLALLDLDKEQYPLKIESSEYGLYLPLKSQWAKTPNGTKIYPTKEHVLKKWTTIDTVKFIDRWSPPLKNPCSKEFEISPRENPFNLEVGDKIRLTVYLNGEPKSGVTVAYHGNVRGITNKNGDINIRIKHNGFQHFSASYKVENAAQKESYIYVANLNLTIKG